MEVFCLKICWRETVERDRRKKQDIRNENDSNSTTSQFTSVFFLDMISCSI